MTDLPYIADVAEEFGRRIELDNLRKFKQWERPHPKQRDYFEDRETREVHMLGSNRSGKTMSSIAMVWDYIKGTKKNVWIVSRSAASTREVILPFLYDGDRAFIPRSEIANIRQTPDHEITGHDGWRIVLKSNEQGPDKFAGADVDLIYFDEPPDWAVYKECVVRFGAGKKCLIRIGATLLPEIGQAGGVCQWLWVEKIKPWLDGTAPRDYRIVNVKMTDNPYISPEQIETAKQMFPAGSLDRRIRIDGELLPGLLGARCYAGFERRLHVNKTIGRATIDPMLPLYIGVDVNVDPLCAVAAQMHGRIWRVLEEFTLRPGTLPELGENFRERYMTHRNEIVLCGDQMGEHRHAQTGKTDYELILAAMQGGPKVRLSLPVKNPPDRDRVNLANFLMGAGGSPVRFEVSHECPYLIADLEQVLWSPDGGHIKKSHKKEDPYYQLTHVSDAWTYIAWIREAAAITKAASPGRRAGGIPTPQYGGLWAGN